MEQWCLGAGEGDDDCMLLLLLLLLSCYKVKRCEIGNAEVFLIFFGGKMRGTWVRNPAFLLLLLLLCIVLFLPEQNLRKKDRSNLIS